MLDQQQDELPTTTFFNGKKKCNFQLINGEIKFGENVLPIENVITVQHKCAGTKTADPKKFTIKYATRKKKNLWKLTSITLQHSDKSVTCLWVTTIKNHLKNLSYRPKKLLLFVNPHGGKKVGLKIYTGIAKPLFDLAALDVSIVVSQRRHQIRDIILHHNLENVDAIACIGGDGTVSELINGLVLRECRLIGTNPNKTSQDLPKPKVPIGIIPAGSTDTTTYCLHGTTNVKTAVLHIIMGKCLGLDLVSVHNENSLIQIYADIASYGYLGDIAYYSEKLRWMGPYRYEYTGFKKIMANQGYNGKITILSDETCDSITRCYENCQKCSSDLNEEDDFKKWIIVEGKFFMIAGTNISCAGERNPNGLSPYSHLGDGYLQLLIIRHTSLFNSLKTLQRFTRSTFSVDDLSHVQVYRTKEFRFKAQDVVGRWNCDGEVLGHTDIHVRVHRQLVSVFGRGIANPKK